nr:hypothetical protein [Tanacetum cinerariifolium]
MASFLIRRVNSPLCTSIKARPVFRKHIPRIKGTQGSGSKSTTTKSAGKWNIPTFTLTSLAIPIGLETDRSASSRVMQVGVSSGSDNSFHTESGMRLGIGALTGAAMGSETRVSDWVTAGSVPDPEDEAMLELMNLDIISV